jgi:hypothetical protein
MQHTSAPASKLTTQGDLHSAKHESAIVLTEDGMQINESDERQENVFVSKHEGSKPRSRFTIARRLHSLKHSAPSAATEQGIQIDLNSMQQRMAEGRTSERREPYSNVIGECDPNHPTQASHSSPTDGGMLIIVR